MRTLNLDHLRALATVVELGSFSAAARQLNLTQPAISLQIRDLEQRYGVTLVERLGKRAYATAAGHDLLEHQVRLAAEVERALATLRRYREGWLGRVRFGTGAATLAYLLLPPLKRLRQEHPTLELVASTGFADDVVEAIRENRLDLALVTLPADTRGLVVRRVRSDPLVAVLPRADRGLVASLPAKPGAADLAALPLILESQRGGLARLILGWFAAQGVAPRPAMQLGSIEAVRNAVAAGLGIAILPVEATEARHVALELEARPLRPPLQRTLALVHRREKGGEPALRIVAEAVMSIAHD